MIDWRENVIDALSDAVKNDSYWSAYLNSLLTKESSKFSVHLGVFIEPFLRYILDGKKTIETRFSIVRCAPYKRVESGDVVLLKKSGGDVIGICQIRSVRFYRLEKDSWDEIKTFARDICAEDPEFWEQRKKSTFATLMRINNVKTIDPITIKKRDRRGWVILQEASKDLLFEKTL
jgi:ASC-1-like (ASCH) protein